MHTHSGLRRASGPDIKAIERSHVPRKNPRCPMRDLPRSAPSDASSQALSGRGRCSGAAASCRTPWWATMSGHMSGHAPQQWCSPGSPMARSSLPDRDPARAAPRPTRHHVARPLRSSRSRAYRTVGADDIPHFPTPNRRRRQRPDEAENSTLPQLRPTAEKARCVPCGDLAEALRASAQTPVYVPMVSLLRIGRSAARRADPPMI